jgi:hypothetical protein
LDRRGFLFSFLHLPSTRLHLLQASEMDAINTHLADKSYINGYHSLSPFLLPFLFFRDDQIFVSVFMNALDYTTNTPLTLLFTSNSSLKFFEVLY